MSDAVRCPKCGFIYWSRWNENWGTCANCSENNDFYKGEDKPQLVDSNKIFTFIKNNGDKKYYK